MASLDRDNKINIKIKMYKNAKFRSTNKMPNYGELLTI